MNITIYGHAYTRVFTYTEDGIHHEFKTNGGIHLLRDILNPDAENGNSSIPEGLDRIHYEIQRFEDEQSKQSYWAIDRHLGKVKGQSAEKAMTVGSGENLVVWDERFGGLSLPDKDCSVLWASNKALPDQEQFSKIADNCFLFLDADVLRRAGAMISRQISWERTASELIWQLQNNPAISYLLKAPHILISFAEDGAVYIWHESSELNASLALTHGGGESSLRGKLKGDIDDAFIVMTANLVDQFPAVLKSERPLQIMQILKTAEALMTSGYTLDNLKNSEYSITREWLETTFPVPVTPGQSVIDPDHWCISNSVSDKRVFDIAFNYVLEGAKEIEGLPQLSFGALTTVDRWEIEAYQNIRNLIVGYAEDTSVRPLSIAVFGSPGSGKSFGVTQIAKNVLPGKVEKLEFNVSQFTGLADLGAAFQKVRDIILEGKLPLVFFDEFDSANGDLPLGWIKYFLMPMQDGKFKDDSGEHPLGKCILVFAGGTAASFAEFIRPMNPGYEVVKENNGFDELNILKMKPDEAKKHDAFKNVKGPDFVSRLKGTIDVLGPNQKDKNDKNYILRRALLLRSLCERKLNLKKGKEAPISKNIIWAMLLVPQYKHGARSMEAILDMSRLEGNVWEPVSLPFYSQLSLHVDADAFIKLVLREVILNSYIEQLAQAIHADYLKEMKAAKQEKHPSFRSMWTPTLL